MIITGTFKNIAKVAGVAEFFKMMQMLQCLKKMWQVLQGFSKKNAAGAAGLFECCGDVNKRCSVRGFPRFEGNLRCCTCA